MKVHELKCWPEPFQALRRRLKTYELRVDDGRGFEVGDVLRLEEFDPEDVDGPGWTGEVEERFVTYITRGPAFGLPEGMVVMSLADLPPRGARR